MVLIGRIRLDFDCVHNAGRSQIAAFAKRAERGLKDTVEIHSGGTNPADTVHEEVGEGMAEARVDIADTTPKCVADPDKFKDTNYLVAVRCSITKFNPAQYGVKSYEWNLTNPDGQDMETVREVRDEIEYQTEILFDELERPADEKRPVRTLQVASSQQFGIPYPSNSRLAG